MASWLLFHFRALRRRLWVTVAGFCALALFAAVTAGVLAPIVPSSLAKSLGGDAVDKILTVLASSMLAVATFSLSTLTTVYAAAATNATPRATTLLIEDPTARRALAIFVGTFVYSVVGLIVLSSGYYGAGERVILFGMSVFVTGVVVVTLIRWIDKLTRLGRVNETINRVESVTRKAIEALRVAPFLGGRPYAPAPEGARPIAASEIGYLQYIDVTSLQDQAEAAGRRIHVEVLPGAFAHRGMVLGYHTGASASEEEIDAMRSAFVIGDGREYEDDPRFGLIVLSEVASRALSPAVNDPGTAIDVIGTQLRLLTLWSDVLAAPEADIRYPDLFIKPLPTAELFDDAFVPIARDGAALVEVAVSLQKALGALALLSPGFRDLAEPHSKDALARSEDAMTAPADIDRVRKAAANLSAPALHPA